MPADIETLLAEAPWLARLARSLVGNPSEADDIVQETYAAALRSPPEVDRPVRPWLRRVATNIVRMRYRGRTRRAANESIVEAQTEPVRSPEQLLERAQLERRLAELVLELDDPFRTTVLLRYREGLSAEQIAKQHGIPAGTVRSRLKTALDRIRRDLDAREHKHMRAVFAPLAAVPVPGGSSAPIAGSLLVAKTKLAAVAVVVVAMIVGVWMVVSGQSSVPPRGPTASPVPGPSAADRSVASPTMFVQSGVAPRRVTGRVTSDDTPYGGASIHLLHVETNIVVANATSRADGTFDLGERRADLYVVTATAPGRVAQPVEVDLRRPSAPFVALRLTGCSHVRGTVVDGSGAPIANARVARDDARTVVAETDANGAYDLCTPFGMAPLRYSASGYQSLLVMVAIADTTRRDVVLIPEAAVEGKVVTRDGAAVPGAWVMIDPRVVRRGERGASVGGFSGADGAFRITGVSPGRNVITGVATGLVSKPRQEIVVGAGEVASGIVVRLEPAAAVTGVVVAGGTPVPGVGVGMRVGSLATGVLAVTQADGSFTIDRAPLGDVALYVEHHIVKMPRSVRVTAQIAPVRIDVQRMGGARGRVLRAGKPVADAHVACSEAHPPVFSDAAGNYVCDGLDDGPRELYADLATGAWGKAVATITRGETAQVDIELSLSAGICGRVVDERGAAIAGLEVRVSEQTTGDFGRDISGDDGAFCARLLTGGIYDVTIYGGARRLDPRPVLGPVSLGPTETAHVTIAVAAPRLTISGSVTDPDGVPVVDAIVRGVETGTPAQAPGGDPEPRVAVTDEAGRFTLERLAVGEFTVSATARDGSEVVRSPVAAGTRDLALVLAAAGRIEGELVGFATAPTITIQSVTNYAVVDAEVDGSRFRASGFSPGDYVLVALSDARDGDITQVTVPSGKTARVTLTNRGTTTITGTVRDFRTRAPVPGMRCAGFALHGETTGAVYTGPDDAVANDANGEFRLVSTAGRVMVTCFGTAANGSRVGVVQRDSPTRLDVFVVRSAQRPGTIDAEFELVSRRIRTIVPGGMAERAGLAIGDEIVAVDGVSVAELGAESTLGLIAQRPPGAVAKLAIVRGTEARNVAVTVRSEP